MAVMTDKPLSWLSGALPRLAAFLVSVNLFAACAPMWDWVTPRVPREWTALVNEIRAFEQRIGFTTTGNFVGFTEEKGRYTFCGHASPLNLPYSYEDPAIRWHAKLTETECRVLADGADVYYGKVEAVGEDGTPVTPELISSKLSRFLYLIIHEDCHDQFDFPYGIEEALCNLIAYKAMEAFGQERFGSSVRADWAVRRYASLESQRTRETIARYEELATLYARYERNEVSEDALMRERAGIFSKALRSLPWKKGAMSNVRLASDMTYSRHYPFLESMYDALGRDLPETVAFFKEVDRMKPSPAAVMRRYGLATEESVEFIRAYEAAVVQAIGEALAERQRR